MCRHHLARVVPAAIALLGGRALPAQQAAPTRDSLAARALGPRVLGAQIDVIGQVLRPFHSAYAGPNSLTAAGDRQVSHVYGVYLGDRLTRRFDVYLDVEMVRGAGIGHVVGLAGYTNGDVIRQGSADLGQGPYVARAFARYTLPLQHGATDTLAAAPDQLAAVVPDSRVEITAGKLAASDLFDVNRYANSTRQQFMNWGLFQNTAWDFAADTRGYTNGIAAAWITPIVALRAGSFQMPLQANGNVFDRDVRHARGDNVELTVTAPRTATVVRLLAYENHARMGSYADALAIARAAHALPDIAADDRPGRTKRGWGVNLEQPLADGGETGVFARVGGNDGANEDFAFTEVDRHLSGGIQVAGTRWGRASDRLALGGVQHGISDIHRAYLAAGGRGFLLGDGALEYAPERIVEGYYRLQLGAHVQVTPDVQRIANPGYDRARGPATVLSLRVNVHT
jgi:hypothetical protein